MEAKHAPDATQRFTSRVDDYVKARPGYPAGVVDVLRARVGLDSTWAIADVGSGTGISARLFLQAGNRVFAVEPNDAMRAAAEKSLAHFQNFTSVVGTAERTTLPDGAVHLVVAAQAFHWFDRAAFRAELPRICKPGGQVLLLWNDRLLAGSPFLEAYERLLQQFATDYKAVNHQNITPEDLAAFFGRPPSRADLPNEQRLDFEGLRARLLSSSYVPRQGHERFAAMLAELRRIYDVNAEADAVRVLYRTQMFFGPLAQG